MGVATAAVQSASASDASAPAPATSVPSEPAAPGSARAPAPWPQLAAVFPGPIIHSAGPWLQGRQQTAQRLLWWELSGLGLTIGSLALLASTGAARDTVGPNGLLLASGFGLFSTSYLTSVYATMAPHAGLGVARHTPLLLSRVGYLHVSDPQFSTEHFATTALDLQWRALHVGVNTAHAPLHDAAGAGAGLLRALLGWRVWGEQGVWAARGTTSRSYLELQTAWTQERRVSSGFSIQTFEGNLDLRLDVQHYLSDVRGAFLQFGAGYGRQNIDYDLAEVSDTDDAGLLLAHAGFGVYLGHGDAHGEAEIYIDQRHDGLVGGLKVPGLGSGVLGHFGARADYFPLPPWGLSVQAEVGSSLAMGVSLAFEQE